ncbi:MAG: hypothetical protein PHC60_09395 [Heliobacteriaceae bacterium]|nr:hypothetical protein [Heliobacteriaceae bacterium]MDD4588587.1 hypothetical protein [Heliobacteriaceae bacterium]
MHKFTLALTIIAAIVVILFFVIIIADSLFNQKIEKEVKTLFNDATKQTAIVGQADLAGLPACVQKWLAYSQVIGKPRISTVRLKQKGLMRTTENQPWMATEAEQYYTIDEPGFIWKARVKMNPLLHFVGRDKYNAGNGNMLIKLVSLITVVDARGEEIDQGTLLRYLGETVWFPTAALSSYIKWEDIDANSARATMSYKGVTAAAVFHFNQQGEVTTFTCERYMTVSGKQYSLEEYVVPLWDYQEFNGIKVPTKGEAIWRLKTGDFSYYQMELTGIEYNQPRVY